ncbi:hypothetical protein JYU34_004615 [Plutella xylostella]|uniref:Uncharacterized protein n=1 Tax=Plutella xylostella TaxID=51655 RepID=A0ABQ7QYE9_PLUXY|nr:hypothetical protein JYU34_004615 [Plutella xylostella]
MTGPARYTADTGKCLHNSVIMRLSPLLITDKTLRYRAMEPARRFIPFTWGCSNINKGGTGAAGAAAFFRPPNDNAIGHGMGR